MVEIGRNVVFSQNPTGMEQLKTMKQHHQSRRTSLGYSMMFLNSFSSCDLNLLLTPVSSGLYLGYPWSMTGNGDTVDITHWLQKNANFIHFLPGSRDFSWRIPRPLRVNPRCSLAPGNACVTGDTGTSGDPISMAENSRRVQWFFPALKPAFSRLVRVPNQYETPCISLSTSQTFLGVWSDFVKVPNLDRYGWWNRQTLSDHYLFGVTGFVGNTLKILLCFFYHWWCVYSAAIRSSPCFMARSGWGC